MSFAQVLKDMMNERNVTQFQLAEGIGYSQRAVSKWVNKQAEPTETAIVACAKFFGVSADELLGIDSAREEEKFSQSKNSALDEMKSTKVYSLLSEKGKARVLAYTEFVLEEERMKSIAEIVEDE
ncbi:MAG: helix-turn-helix transcriptional regulator [Clostridia bacterium]|nr:helix-turn-helix transcriptional regulator [Clostridia bacterium]